MAVVVDMTEPKTYVSSRNSVKALRWPVISTGDHPIDIRTRPMHAFVGLSFADCWMDGQLWGRIWQSGSFILVPPGYWVLSMGYGVYKVLDDFTFERTYEPAN